MLIVHLCHCCWYCWWCHWCCKVKGLVQRARHGSNSGSAGFLISGRRRHRIVLLWRCHLSVSNVALCAAARQREAGNWWKQSIISNQTCRRSDVTMNYATNDDCKSNHFYDWVVFMSSPIQQLGPETLCFKLSVRPSVVQSGSQSFASHCPGRRLSTWPTTAVSCPTALGALCGQLTFRLAWCCEHSVVMAKELLQPRDLACGTLFQSTCVTQTSPMDCKLFRRQLKGHLYREAWTRRSVTSDMWRHT